ncbi:hypothetical protein SDC9_146764 [bioreactor metagenome]|uniref:Uncharacterized protein n=1 Tax=bioreactor metagenome TaxID=1076179 RepID=A0A645EG30_9ZZZZ
MVTLPNFVTLSFSEAVWTQKILPSNTGDFYSYLEDVDGETYFAVKGTIKNESGEGISPEDIVGKALFNDKYEYTIQVKAEGEDGSDFYCFSLDPLKQTTLYMLVSVPDDIRNNFNECKMTFGFNDKMLYVEDTLLENLPYKYVIVIQK